MPQKNTNMKLEVEPANDRALAYAQTNTAPQLKRKTSLCCAEPEKQQSLMFNTAISVYGNKERQRTHFTFITNLLIPCWIVGITVTVPAV